MNGMARGSASADTQAFAQRLRAARESAGFATASEFAKAIGVEPPAYRKWERGEAEPGIADLARIHRQFRLSLDWLIAGSVPVSASPPGFPATQQIKRA